jgi:urease accessory protein
MADNIKTQTSEFLTSLRLADSFLPVGTYSSSYGLESFVQEGIIDNSDDLRELLKDYLRHLVAPSDIVAISSVYDAGDESDIDKIIQIDNKYHSTQVAKEFRESSIKSGNNLLELFIETSDYNLLNKIHEELPHCHYVTVLGIISNDAQIKKIDACLTHVYSFMTELISAAQRLFQLSHIKVQQILSNLQPIIVDSCQANINKNITQMQSFCPWITIMGMKHEREDVKLFMS